MRSQIRTAPWFGPLKAVSAHSRDIPGRNSVSMGKSALRAVVRQAEAGQFYERSWHHWHYRFGFAEPDGMRSRPIRRLPRRGQTDGL